MCEEVNKQAKKEKYEQINDFKNVIIRHPKLDSVYTEILNAIEAKVNSIILVVGPTGVGKTAVKKKVKQKILENAKQEMEIDRAKIPVIDITAVPQKTGDIMLKDMYIRALNKMDEILVDKKVNYFPDKTGKRSQDVLSRAYTNTIMHRKVDAVLIDEAQHLVKISNSNSFSTYLDTIKTLAEETESVHVLFGTYDAINIAELNEQLCRRTHLIHFPRYEYEGEDLVQFIDLITSFQSMLPFDEPSNLIPDRKYIYTQTMGCVGMLKDLLTKALCEALNNGDNNLDLRHLENNSRSAKQCLNIIERIKQGEKEYEHYISKEKIKQLGYVLFGEEEKIEEKKEEAASKNKTPGMRNPSRDPVGLPG